MENETKRQSVSDGRKFGLGNIYVTRAALGVLTITDMNNSLQRHVRGDWGSVGSDDWESNDSALLDDSRLLSVYGSAVNEVFWIITEWDRSLTTILLPGDY